MALLLNKLPSPVEFNHGGQTLKLPPGEQVFCTKELLKALSMYPAVRAHFDEGNILLNYNDEEAATAGVEKISASVERNQDPAPAPVKKKNKQQAL